MLKKLRNVERGGRMKKNGACYKYGEKYRRWKVCAEKLKKMIAEKKERCWRKYCEKNGRRDLWEVVRWAKDPWRLKTRMRNMTDMEGKRLVTDQEKVEGLVGDVFA